MKNSIKWIAAIGFVLLAASVFLRTYAQIHKDPDQDQDEEQEAVRLPSRVSIVSGETVITLDARTQKNIGITVAPLRPVNTRKTETAAAVVLTAQGLVALRSNYVAAEATLERAQAQLAVSSSEYERLRKLYQENQNASQKALQAANGVVQIDRTALDAAHKELQIASAAAQQSWGGAVAHWVANDSSRLADVLDQKATLVEVTLPPQVRLEDPPEISLSTPQGFNVDAAYVSPFPQIDPRIQGISELYIARGYPIIEPGMNLIAHMPVGNRLRGVLIPRSAIVWWQGEAWVYQAAGRDRFIRREAPTGTPLDGGYFAATGFAPRTELVVRGAQFLLSEEFRSQIQPED